MLARYINSKLEQTMKHTLLSIQTSILIMGLATSGVAETRPSCDDFKYDYQHYMKKYAHCPGSRYYSKELQESKKSIQLEQVPSQQPQGVAENPCKQEWEFIHEANDIISASDNSTDYGRQDRDRRLTDLNFKAKKELKNLGSYYDFESWIRNKTKFLDSNWPQNSSISKEMFRGFMEKEFDELIQG